MDLLFKLIYFALLLSVIVFIHELGHFMTAKFFGVYCGEFAIGMGPRLLKKQGKETIYSIRAFPVGGFVQMAGEEDAKDEKYKAIPAHRTIKGIAVWKQVIIMAAGIVMNLLLALVIFIGIFMYQQQAPVEGTPVVSTVEKSSAAATAGLQAGDIVQSITLANGTKTTLENSSQFITLTQTSDEIIYTVKRGDKVLDLKITPVYSKEQSRYLVGISMEQQYKKISILESFGYGTNALIKNVGGVAEALINLVHGTGLQNLSGPLGIFNVTSQYANKGILAFLSLVASLSISVAIFNAVPLPIFDGGRILIVLLEKLFRRKMGDRIESIVMGFGLFCIVALMVFVTWNDITKLFL